jgi:5-methyltetrahydrofolate--homocysteine methyltransferase
LVAIETMSDLLELKAVMLAVKENTKLPVFAMMTFDKSGMGHLPAAGPKASP